jgi:neopullulanase
MIKRLILATLLAAVSASPSMAQSYRDRLPEDEVIYFLLPDRFDNGDASNDRGGLKGDRLKTGYDLTSKGFYHGGDLKGLLGQLDYIQSLGATAIWLAPIFKNKPVQGAPGQETAAYHGYWVTDFTTVDPHFGSEADFKALVDAAHARGLKVYMDIITNHTADVIAYQECPASSCVYRSRADYPYGRRAADGALINKGFLGESVQSAENFSKLTDPNFAYTPIVPKAERTIKVPAWLNDPLYYHNRGDTTFAGENSTMGDFVGLDDLMTENPRVVQGFIDIYGAWIDRYGIDGYRIDTAKHVNPEFWASFAPAMLARAKARGINHFHIFGEVASGDIDIVTLARFTRVAKLPTVLDFAFRRAAIDTVAGKAGTDELVRLFEGDDLYEGGTTTALRTPTFLGNHDFGRFAHEARIANPTASDAEILKRTILAHAMLMTLRGVPVIYAGDEQGFAGDGGDQDAREDMFASQVASYNDNKLVGTSATTASRNFDRGHPLYQLIAKLSGLRAAEPALRRGHQIIRNYSNKPGLFAVSRLDPHTNAELLLVFNTSASPLKANVEVDVASQSFSSLYGACPASPTTAGSLAIMLEPLDFIICKSLKHP